MLFRLFFPLIPPGSSLLLRFLFQFTRRRFAQTVMPNRDGKQKYTPASTHARGSGAGFVKNDSNLFADYKHISVKQFRGIPSPLLDF